MSDRPKYPRADALQVAESLLELLKGACDRIEIKGSIHREKPLVGDIELLLIPSFETRQIDFFSSAPMNLAWEKVERMLKEGILEKRLNREGRVSSWGDKNRHCIHKPSRIPLDLFATTPENWWVSSVIRTGSKETNLDLTNGAIALGRSLLAYGAGVRIDSPQVIDEKLYQPGAIIVATSEAMVFRLCGVKWREPKDR
jgi:DNA polymerase/3'-5' exonuclease PolX